MEELNMEFTLNPKKEEDPLKSFGRNLTQMASSDKLDPIIGRDDEIRRLIRILSRKTKNNPILIGEPGVGKTAIVEGLAQRIIAGQVPDNLKDKEIYEIDLPGMIAGASFQGQFEKRIKSLMKKIKDSNGKIIIFIDEIHMIIGTGKNAQGGMDAAQIIKPMLSRGEMRLIGATTLGEHRKYIESDPAFERRMQKIVVNESSEIESITILRGIKTSLENYHHVKISDQALIAAVKFSTRYISDRFLPDKAIDLIDEAAASIKTEINSQPELLEKEIEKIATLSMEKAALKGEKDLKANTRFIEVGEQLKKHEKKRDKLHKK
jgi:ATP-dependent Clp protease ATP-binding subunit ClpB